MAPHSSTLAWKIPWMEEPGRLQSMGSWRIGHDWATSLSLFTFMHWRRKWQPTPVFLPEESQGWGSLVGCCLWGRTESELLVLSRFSRVRLCEHIDSYWGANYIDATYLIVLPYLEFNLQEFLVCYWQPLWNGRLWDEICSHLILILVSLAF